jgi:hypothetical protein
MAKIAYRCRSEDTKTHGNRRMEVDELHQKIEEAGIQERNPAINEVALKIFVPPSSFRLKDNVFIAEEGICDGQNVGRDDEEEIVNARIEKVVEGCIDKSAENCIPSTRP